MQPELTRRTALKGAAAAGLLGGLGALATNPAGAQISNAVSINDITVATDEGDLSFVDVAVDGSVSWDGFDVPVDAFAWEVIVHVEAAGGATGSHTLFDQRASGGGDGPVLLANVSSQGNGGDGWGGPGEFVDHLADDNRAGLIQHDSDWRYLADSDVAVAKSIEDPAVIGTDVPELDNDADDSTITHVVTLDSRLYLYSETDTGATPVASETRFGDGRDVYPLGQDDGTFERARGQSSFDVAVTNEPAETGAGGTATATGG